MCALAHSFPEKEQAAPGETVALLSWQGQQLQEVLGEAGLWDSGAAAGAVRSPVGLRVARACQEAMHTEPTSTATVLLTLGDVALWSPA